MTLKFKSIFILLVALGLNCTFLGSGVAQMTVAGGANATALAQALAGPGITVSNAVLTGSPAAAGTFANGGNIGMNTGILLCTGPVTIAPGPNNSGSAGQDNGQPGNALLNGLAGANTFNAVVLEFDFVPLSNTIEFDYVFGSEEYPEFVNSGFNDAFGFFISGPGIVGQPNIARVPGTALPVTIDNINAGSFNQYYVNNAGGTSVQYDAFTTVLTAQSVVQACETYHLRIMIADAGDGVWDSGVFLEEGSLTSAVVEITTTTATADSTAYENCSNATVTFTLSEAISTDFVVNYNITGTATNGVDFPTIPSTVTIPANSLSTSFLIEPVFDGTAEGIETVIIDVQTSVCGSDTIMIFINDVTPVTLEAFGDTAFCGGTAMLWAQAQGGGGGYNYSWSNGMVGDTIYVSPGTTTTYTVTANDYCNSTVPVPTADVTVTVDPTPVANAGPDQPYCAGDNVTLSGSGGATYEWYDITNGVILGNTASATISPVGDVDFRMIAWFGACSDTDFVSITELPASPAAAVGDTSICGNQSTPLDVIGGVGSSFSWSPVAGLSNPLIQNPIATPTATTTYTVTVTSPSGCVKTDSVEVIIDPSPQVDFSVADVCYGTPSSFVNMSTISSGSIQSFTWDFGDSNTNSTYSPSNAYGTDGTYNVQLLAVSGQGCADSITHSAIVNPIPVASFNFSNDCEDKLIPFYDQSAVTSGAIDTWDWDFGFSSSSVQNPAPQYFPSDGLFNVQLTVETAAGCTDDTMQTVEIYPLPIADFTFDSVCLGLNLPFTDLSSQNGAYVIDSWNWSFSDGQTSTDQNPLMLFDQHGMYSAQLTVSTSVGCVDNIQLGDAVVYPLPVSEFDDDIKNCLNDTTWFNDLSSVPSVLNDQIVSWNWDLGDGANSAIASFNHLYNNYNLYAVTLITETDKGCSDTVSHVVEIFPLPEVAFTSDVTEGCQPLRVLFQEQCSIPAPYTIQQWTWNLGDGDGPINNQNPMNVYNSDTLNDLNVGQYTVSLRATSGNGCVTHDTVVNYITEYPKPDALFAAKPYVTDVLNPEIEFEDLSSENVVEWYWEFGDGAYGSTQHPSHSYPDVGTYEVTQYVTTNYGCMDTISGEVKVEPIFTFYIPSAFTPDADGINEEFFGDGEGIKSYAMYIYDRWGEEIFVSYDRDYKWDGTYKGKQVQLGTYIYYFFLTDWKNDDHEYRGHVTLMR